MTDIPRLRAGHVGAQFWSVWIPADTQGPAAVQMTIEQIDLVKQICSRYPNDFAMAYTGADIVRVHKSGRIACLIGVEGGHQINNSLAVLRAYLRPRRALHDIPTSPTSPGRIGPPMLRRTMG